MKKSLANQIAKLWNENFAGYTEATKTKAVVTDNGGNDYAVEVNPTDANTGHAFYAHAELSDIERTFKVSAYVSQDENGLLYGRIY